MKSKIRSCVTASTGFFFLRLIVLDSGKYLREAAVILLACDTAWLWPVTDLARSVFLLLCPSSKKLSRSREKGKKKRVFKGKSVFVNSGSIWGTSHPAACTSGWSGSPCCPLLKGWARWVEAALCTACLHVSKKQPFHSYKWYLAF